MSPKSHGRVVRRPNRLKSGISLRNLTDSQTARPGGLRVFVGNPRGIGEPGRNRAFNHRLRVRPRGVHRHPHGAFRSEKRLFTVRAFWMCPHNSSGLGVKVGVKILSASTAQSAVWSALASSGQILGERRAVRRCRCPADTRDCRSRARVRRRDRWRQFELSIAGWQTREAARRPAWG